ncbi:MAG: hypothetical protein PG981_000728 [Wolbachia endosymbiont of Ctenocephalides orientis wCori]|nr:MAG: hypothetical protein PG981_000728 [Wolbachia endosymbiont of Ctenocephalides orientis wCori]
MGKIFTIKVDESFFDVLVQHIFSKYEKEKIQELKIILPCKTDVIALLKAFKNYNTRKCIILPEIISLENIDEEDLILNLDKIKVISPTKKVLLLIQFILKWNKDNNDSFPIDLSCSLSSLLDKVQFIQKEDYTQCDEYSKKIESFIRLLSKTWSKTLRDLKVIDILKHKSDYINNMLLSLQTDQHIIFVGIVRDEIYKSLVKAIYDLPFGKIILPNLNLAIKENDWKCLDKKHYQYCLKSLLSYLGVARRDVISLSREGESIADYVFDVTSDLSKASGTYNSNIEVITCDSEEEEAQVTSLIIENEGYQNVSLLVINKLLATRIACLSKQYSSISDSYSYITLLLYGVEVLTSNWSSVALLSLLKHNLVNFGYAKEEYSKILFEFEIDILRAFNISSLKDIINIISNHKNLNYKKDLLVIINKLKVVYNSLLKIINHPISEILPAHLHCIDMLSGINLLDLNDEIGNFIRNFVNACENVAIDCSWELYSKILILFLNKEFSSAENNLNKFTLYHNKVVILAGFNESHYPPSFQNPFLNTEIRERFNLYSVQEEQGYFLYILHNLFCARKVYITRSLSQRKPTLLRRLEVLLQGNLFKQPYRTWLRMLNTPERVVPCSQPMPKPEAKVRKEVMQSISCSALEKLIRNPYSFYAEYILGLKQLRDLNFRPSILEFGIIVHNILQKYLLDQKQLMRIAHQEFSSSRFDFSNMWWIRLQRVLNSFVEFDNIEDKHIEVEKTFVYRVPILNRKEILLTARCDRLEYLQSGQVAIVDYKLGSPPSNEEVMSGFFPQLILQALAVEKTVKMDVSELAYWKLDYDKIKVTLIQNFKEKMQEFQNDLPDFLSTYLSNDTPFIASPYLDKFLRFNNYKQLERVGEWL